MTDVSTDLAAFFETGEVTPEALEAVADQAHVTFAARERFATLANEYRQRVEDGQGEALKLASAYLILGRFQEALTWFSRTPDNRFRRFYAARAALGLNNHELARQELQQAGAMGWNPFEIDMALADIHLRRDEVEPAERLVHKHEQAGRDRAEWYYIRGLLAEQRDDRELALDEFERALTLDPDHPQAMFRAARLYDISGLDDRAIELYQRLALQPRAYVNALLNLAVIHEDTGAYEEGVECLQRVLRAYPNHSRARMFLKDVVSCRTMVQPEAGDEQSEPRNRLLDMPVTEFELSVRARNCLKKMNIRTLGDLVKLSEAELMAYKNFGETSLTEIKAVLAKRGLHLGQTPEEDSPEAAPPPPQPAVIVPPGREAILSRPVSELELSVRARRCLQRLNVQTLGDLIQLSESDLLSTRNFGVTSLNEVKARLAESGLALATKKNE